MNLGDSLYKSSLDNKSQVGVRQIIKSSNSGSTPVYRQFSMTSLHMDRLDEAPPSSEEVRLLNAEVSRLKSELSKEKEATKKTKEKLEDEAVVAMQKGLALGREEGAAEMELEIKQKYKESLLKIQNVQESIQKSINKEVQNVFHNLERESAHLALTCVKKVFDYIAKHHEEGIISIVRQAVEVVGSTTKLTLKLHPEDCETIEKGQSLWEPASSVEKIKIEKDHRISKGSCIVESDTSSVEMDLDKIAKVFESEVENVFRIKSLKMEAAVNQNSNGVSEDVIKGENE